MPVVEFWLQSSDPHGADLMANDLMPRAKLDESPMFDARI